MTIKDLQLDRCEVVKKKYDNRGRLIEEEAWIYYPPEMKTPEIGYQLTKHK